MFLDEIGDMSFPAPGQAAAGAAGRQFSRLGGKGDVHVDVPGHHPRPTATSSGRRRRKVPRRLYFRLNVVTITIPAASRTPRKKFRC